MLSDEFDLSFEEVISIEGLINSLRVQSPRVDDIGTVDLGGFLANQLPRRLLVALEDFRRYGNHSGVLLIHGFPVADELPPTPMIPNSSASFCAPSAAALLLTLSRLGDPISYSEEKNGALVHDICPVPGEEGEQQNTGSVYFELHTENVFHPNLPHFLGLICLRPAKNNEGALVTCSIREAQTFLTASEISVLRESRYQTRVAPSFCRGAETRRYLDPAPILTGSGGHTKLAVDFDDTKPLDAEARSAMSALHDALQKVRRVHRLKAGTLAVIDNRQAVHGRLPFTPKYDGCDRWLQRLFVVTSIREALPIIQSGTNFRCKELYA